MTTMMTMMMVMTMITMALELHRIKVKQTMTNSQEENSQLRAQLTKSMTSLINTGKVLGRKIHQAEL